MRTFAVSNGLMEAYEMQAIRVKEVAAKTGSSVPTVWRWAKNDPSFPRPIKLSPGITVFDAALIDAWMDQRVSESRKADA